MSIKNLEKTAKKLGDIYTRKLEEGEKDPFRVALQAYIPQVAAQDLNILRTEIKVLRKEQIVKNELDEQGNPRTTKPILTLSESTCIALYEKLFDAYKTSQFTRTFNGVQRGTEGVKLTKELYNELLIHAQKKLGGGEWLVTPCLNLNSFDRGVKKKYADKLAELEIANRKNTSRRSDDIEESFISKRLTGFQGSHVPGGPSKGQEYRPGTGLTDYQKTQTGIQLGHGDKGQPTYAYKADEAKKIIQEATKLDQKYKNKLIKAIEQKERELKIAVEHRENVTIEKFNKGYKFLLFTGQQTKENVKDQQEEVKKGSEMQQFMVDQILSHHDSRIDKTIGSLLINKLTKNNKGVRNISKRHRSKSRIKSKEKTKPITTKYKTKSKRVIAKQDGLNATVFAKKVLKGSKSIRQTKSITPAVGTTGSPLHLLAIFNANLEQSIRENMGGSALHNRTGRFAGSVNVLNIIPVPGTTGTIQYSYMRDPYEVFEGQGRRDPRLLIDQTLREQAAEMALGKFTTQRV